MIELQRTRSTHIRLQPEDRAAVEEDLAALVERKTDERGVAQLGPVKAASFKDPDGNILNVGQAPTSYAEGGGFDGAPRPASQRAGVDRRAPAPFYRRHAVRANLSGTRR